MKNKLYLVSVITLILNIILTIIKLIAGRIGNSPSLVSDGYNSLTDIIVSIIIIVALKVSRRRPDANHPYGHEKYEGIVYLFLGVFLALSAMFVGYLGIKDLIYYFTVSKEVEPGKPIALIVAIVAIIIKVFMFLLNRYFGKKYDVPTLKGDALNHLFDIIATSVSLISIIIARFNLHYFEYIASIIIALIIIKTSVSMIKEAIKFLVDEAPDKKTIKAIKKTALAIKGVLSVDDLKVRLHMNKLYVDIEIGVDNSLSLVSAHEIAEQVHLIIEKEYDVLHCMVHVNPLGRTSINK